MGTIDFQKIINDYSEESFDRFLELTDHYIKYYFEKPENPSKELVTEKIGNYLEHFIADSKIRDDELAELYVNGSFAYLEQRIDQKNERVGKYFKKLSAIQEDIMDADKEILIEKLEDYTKIFLCLYAERVKDFDNQISSINFHIDLINIVDLLKKFDEDAPKIKLLEDNISVKNLAARKAIKAVDKIHLGGANFANHAQQLAEKIAEMVPTKEINRESLPVYYVKNSFGENDILTEKKFIEFCMILFYLRDVDLESVID